MDEPRHFPDGPVPIPATLSILPLRDIVHFPGGHIMVPVGRAKSIKLLEDAVAKQATIGVVAQRDRANEDPRPPDLYTVGALAHILDLKMNGAHALAILHALNDCRFEITGWKQEEPYFVARVSPFPLAQPEASQEPEVQSLKDQLAKGVEGFLTLRSTPS